VPANSNNSAVSNDLLNATRLQGYYQGKAETMDHYSTKIIELEREIANLKAENKNLNQQLENGKNPTSTKVTIGKRKFNLAFKSNVKETVGNSRAENQHHCTDTKPKNSAETTEKRRVPNNYEPEKRNYPVKSKSKFGNTRSNSGKLQARKSTNQRWIIDFNCPAIYSLELFRMDGITDGRQSLRFQRVQDTYDHFQTNAPDTMSNYQQENFPTSWFRLATNSLNFWIRNFGKTEGELTALALLQLLCFQSMRCELTDRNLRTAGGKAEDLLGDIYDELDYRNNKANNGKSCAPAAGAAVSKDKLKVIVKNDQPTSSDAQESGNESNDNKSNAQSTPDDELQEAEWTLRPLPPRGRGSDVAVLHVIIHNILVLLIFVYILVLCKFTGQYYCASVARSPVAVVVVVALIIFWCAATFILLLVTPEYY